MQEQDFRSAQLTLQGAVQSNPRDFEARRMLAELYGTAASPLEFSAWQELVQMEPAEDRNQLGLAEAALRAHNLIVAAEALRAVSPPGRATTTYWRTAAGLASLQGDRSELVKALGQLGQLAPEDKDMQFNLAALRLMGSDPTLAASARTQLIAWARGEPLRIRACLVLIRDLARRKDPAELDALVAAIMPRPSLLRLWSDRVLGQPGPPDFTVLVEYMKQQPNPVAGDVVDLAGWMRAQGFAMEALLWLGTLDAPFRKDPQLQQEQVRCALQLRDWRALESLLRTGAWGPLSDEMLALIFAARVQRENASLAAAGATWNDSLALARNSLPNLRARARLAAAFGWPREMENALWKLVRVAPTEIWAWQALAAGAELEGSADKLLLVLSSWAKSSPEKIDVRADHVLLATLLQRLDAPTRKAASEMAKSIPVPAAITAAQALELQRGGRVADAARLVEPLWANSMGSARVALACGLVLMEAGQYAPARRCLEAAAQVRLLPAEETLRDTARQKLPAPRP
ncbi:MAG: hypothetical protein WCR49_11450 [Opitutae bacterium]